MNELRTEQNAPHRGEESVVRAGFVCCRHREKKLSYLLPEGAPSSQNKSDFSQVSNDMTTALDQKSIRIYDCPKKTIIILILV